MAGETILLVESSEKITVTLSEPIKKVGYKFLNVQWGEEALTLMQNEHVDAILVRDRLPGMNGLDFIQNVRREQKWRIRPIIIMYGKDDKDMKIQAFKTGADEYLVLPFSMPEFFYRLEVRLKKTLESDASSSADIQMSSDKILDLPEMFPRMSSLETKPLPVLMGTSYLLGLSGVLRVIQGKTVRSFFLENGLLRGAHSSKKNESLFKHLCRWRVLLGDVRKKIAEMSNQFDDTLALAVIRQAKITSDMMNALTIRHLQEIMKCAITKKKGEYDWAETQNSKGIALMDGAVHPAHIIISAIRSSFIKPNFDIHFPNLSQYIYPSEREGKLFETLRLSPQEQGAFALLRRNLNWGDFITTGKELVPYFGALAFTAYSFRYIFIDEKRPLSEQEKQAVSHDQPEMKKSIEDIIQDHAGENVNVQDADDLLDGKSMPKPQPPPAPSETKHKKTQQVKSQTPDSHGSNSKPARPKKLVPSRKPPSVKTSPPSDKPKSEPIPKLPAIQLNSELLASGDLNTTPFPFVFAAAYHLGKTGILTVNRDKYSIRLFWKLGKLVFARSDDPNLRLDQVMVQMGMITPEQKSKVDEMIQEMGRMRSGTLIFKQQFVNMYQMMEALEKQMELILKTLFDSLDGQYNFSEEELPAEEHIPLDMDTPLLLMNGIRKLHDITIIERWLPGMSHQLVQTKDSRTEIAQLKLGGIVMNIYDKFRKPAKVHSAIAGAEIPPKEFKLVLLGMILLDLLSSQS